MSKKPNNKKGYKLNENARLKKAPVKYLESGAVDITDEDSLHVFDEELDWIHDAAFRSSLASPVFVESVADKIIREKEMKDFADSLARELNSTLPKHGFRFINLRITESQTIKVLVKDKQGRGFEGELANIQLDMPNVVGEALYKFVIQFNTALKVYEGRIRDFLGDN